jgi:tetratricopeptide (TPR) repeat protein
MGKSALSWVWLHKDVMERAGEETDGIFWWSFYDDPFDSFIVDLYCYMFGEEDNKGGLISIDLKRLMAVLQHRRFLLVLDGLERALRGYAGMEAMFIQEKKFAGNKAAENEWDKRLREPVHPLAAKFLQYLSVGNTKTLITTRLNPAPLEGLAGVKHVFLKGLSEKDAVAFLRSERVKGTRAEMEQAGAVYDFHPLMLKLLSTAISRSRAKDIRDAYRLNLIDRAEPHKILDRGFKVLSDDERQVVSCVAVFRGPFKFEPAKVLFPKMKEDRLWQVLMELRGLGFLFYDEQEERFDFHPILRAFLYSGLTNRDQVHTLAVQYFQALPKEEKVVTLDDLAPVIELYHHLVKAGKFDEAWDLYYNRIYKPVYFQLSAYHLEIELLKELFPDGEDQLPRLAKEADQGWTLNSLANSYALSGQPAKAVPLFLMHNKLREKDEDKTNLAVGLGNVAHMAQLQIGQLSAAAAHLRKENLLGKEIEDNMEIAVSHEELGQILAYRGDAAAAAEEFKQAFELFEKDNYIQSLSVVSSYRSLSALLQARLHAVLPGKEKQCASHAREALSSARQALAFAEKRAETSYPLPRDFVQAYWLLGEALIQCRISSAGDKIEGFDIHFYDQFFQEQVETLPFKKGSELHLAERCLNEALRRCRKINLVEFEPNILLSLARLDLAKNRSGDAEPLLKEALDICLRSGYRLNLADLHLLCGQILIEDKGRDKLLGFTAREHLQKAKEYALDVSELDDLYKPIDPHFYDGIPEYDMLKRGMTKDERTRNGYYMAYRIAEALEKMG